MNEFEKALDSIIATIELILNSIKGALNDVILFINRFFLKLKDIVVLLFQLLFYMTPFVEAIYVGVTADAIWLKAIGFGFIGVIGLVLTRQMLLRVSGRIVPEETGKSDTIVKAWHLVIGFNLLFITYIFTHYMPNQLIDQVKELFSQNHYFNRIR